MAGNSSGNAILGFVVGGLLAFVVLVFAFGWGASRRDPNRLARHAQNLHHEVNLDTDRLGP